jgi:hypothetical protein
MLNPIFTFTQYKNSFHVKVENLELLEVRQIQEIESFVQERKGVFDYETYSFVLQKKINFEEFCTLLEHLEIKATCQENFLHSEASRNAIDFGKYKGSRYSELPDEYLTWLKRNYRGIHREEIDKEFSRRNL